MQPLSEREPFFPQESRDESEAHIEALRLRLKEAEQQLRATPAAQAQWQLRAILKDSGSASLTPEAVRKELDEADRVLEAIGEIKALRAIQRARAELDPKQ